MTTRWLAATVLSGLVINSFTGCVRGAAPNTDDLLQRGSAIVRELGGVDPNLLALKLKSSAQDYLATPHWADVKASLRGGAKLSRADPVCGLTIDSVLDGKPETIETLFLKLTQNTAGMNDSYSLREDALALSRYLSSTSAETRDLAGFSISVAMFKNLYCR